MSANTITSANINQPRMAGGLRELGEVIKRLMPIVQKFADDFEANFDKVDGSLSKTKSLMLDFSMETKDGLGELSGLLEDIGKKAENLGEKAKTAGKEFGELAMAALGQLNNSGMFGQFVTGAAELDELDQLSKKPSLSEGEGKRKEELDKKYGGAELENYRKTKEGFGKIIANIEKTDENSSSSLRQMAQDVSTAVSLGTGAITLGATGPVGLMVTLLALIALNSNKLIMLWNMTNEEVDPVSLGSFGPEGYPAYDVFKDGEDQGLPSAATPSFDRDISQGAYQATDVFEYGFLDWLGRSLSDITYSGIGGNSANDVFKPGEAQGMPPAMAAEFFDMLLKYLPGIKSAGIGADSAIYYDDPAANMVAHTASTAIPPSSTTNSYEDNSVSGITINTTVHTQATDGPGTAKAVNDELGKNTWFRMVSTRNSSNKL